MLINLIGLNEKKIAWAEAGISSIVEIKKRINFCWA